MKRLLEYEEWEELDENKIMSLLKNAKDKIKKGTAVLLKKMYSIRIFNKIFHTLDKQPIPKKVMESEIINLNEESNWKRTVQIQRQNFIDELRETSIGLLDWKLANDIAHTIAAAIHIELSALGYNFGKDIFLTNIFLIDYDGNITNNSKVGTTVIRLYYNRNKEDKNIKVIDVTYYLTNGGKYGWVNDSNDPSSHAIQGYVIGKDLDSNTYEFFKYQTMYYYKLRDYTKFAKTVAKFIKKYVKP